MKALDLLALPSEYTEKFLTGGSSYDQRLDQIGLKNTKGKLDLNDVVSTVGRVALDPLNLIPVGSGAKLGAKVAKYLPGVAKYADDAVKVAKTTAELVDKVPGVANIKNTLGKSFIKGYGLPEAYNMIKDEIPTKTVQGTEAVVKKVQTLFKDVRPDEYEVVAQALEQIPFKKGGAVKGDLSSLISKTGDRFETVIKPVVRQAQQLFREELDDLVTRGRMAKEDAAELLNKGGYYPHVDFAPERLKEYFKGYALGEKRSYLKARKGAEGFTLNAPKAIARREVQQLQDNVIQDFLKDVKTQFGSQLGKGNPMPDGHVQFIDTTGRLRELNGWSLPKNIVDDLNATFKPTSNFVKGLDKMTSLWKTTATSLHPSFHIMNVVGNLYNAWLGGLKDPRRIGQLLDPRAIYKDLSGFSPTEASIIKKSGLLDRGQFADTVAKTFDQQGTFEIPKALEMFREVGERFENNARAAFFLDAREKAIRQGLSEVNANRQALKKVNEYLFDYLSGLTPFESNVMRRIFPFYTWARFNIPLQIKSMVTQPEKAAFVKKLHTAFNAEGIPENDSGGLTFPLPIVDSQGRQVRFRPNLPIQDIMDLSPRRLVNMVSPFAREGVEAARYIGLPDGNGEYTDMYTGKSITNKNLPVRTQVTDIAKNRAINFIRPLRSTAKAAEDDYSPSAILRQIVGGTYTYDPKMVELQKVIKSNEQNRALQNYMQQILRDNSLSREEKLRKLQDFKNYAR